MKGSIQKKGKVYYAVIAINGKRKWFKGGNTKKDAQRVLNQKLTEVDNKTYRDIQRITFRDFSELWLKNYAEPNVKKSTYASYLDIIARLFIPSFGAYQLSDITTGQLQGFVSDRLKSVSPKTTTNELVVLKELFKHALRWGYLKSNPAEYVERPRITKPDIELLNPDEVARLLSNTEWHYKTAIQTAVLTGLRAGELWGLQWDDIDWVSKQIHVRRSLWKGQFQTPKSKASVRKVDIPDSLVSELKKWKLSSPVSEVVFPSPEGKLAQHDNVVKRYYNPALRRAGLRKVSFHSLRHTNASLRILAGQNIKYIQNQMGHASINITLDTYGHLFNDMNFNRQQVELLETSLKSVRNPLEKGGFLGKKIGSKTS